jgi:predicted acylesterase/phospholipase RssA
VAAGDHLEQKAYVDAAVADPLPTLIARRMGAQVVLAINLMRRPDSLGSGRGEADVIMDLVLPRTRMSNFSQRQARIMAGEAAARVVLPRMRQLIASQPG